MNLREKLQAAWDGWRGLTEASGPPFGSQIDQSGAAADRLFRQIGGRAVRDLTSHQLEKQQRIAFWLWLGYGIAKRCVNISVDFIVANGFHVDAPDPQVKDIVKAFWERNEIADWIENLTLELSLFGELFITARVTKGGQVDLGSIDPLLVDCVIIGDDGRTPVKVSVRPVNPGEPPEVLDIIQVDKTAGSPTQGKLVGDVFYFAANKITHATRGNSDLMPAIDWLDQHEQLLFSVAEMARVQMAHVWDVEVKGARGKQLAKYEKKFGRTPKAGQVRIHNENVTVQAIAPDLGSADTSVLGRMLKRHVASAMGIPEQWLSESGEAGKAAAAEMGAPTTKRIENRQQLMIRILERMGRFAVDQAAIVNPALETSATSLDQSVTAPPIWPIDTQRITAGMQTGGQALALAEDRAWLTDEQSSRIFKTLAAPLAAGLLDTEDITEEDEAELETVGAADPADTAMNGAQIASMVDVVRAINVGEISRESGIAILMRAFLMSPSQAAAVAGSGEMPAQVAGRPDMPTDAGGQRDQLEQRMNALDDPQTTPPATANNGVPGI